MKAKSWLALALAGVAAIPGVAVGEAPAPSTDWAGKQVPIEVFGQFPQVDSPRISPDGKWLAMKVRSGGEQVLAIKDVGPGKPELIARDGNPDEDKLGRRQVVGWRWIDDDILLITLMYRDNVPSPRRGRSIRSGCA